ncbi:MAG: hypothetical protein WBE92_00390, partial [Steroidobacteraceae bacterium]
MPAVWLGLPIIAALAIVIWLLTRRVRQSSDVSPTAASRPFSGDAAPATTQPPADAPAPSDAAGAGALS